VSPETLRARAASYFLAPRPHVANPHGDLIPLVRREPPPRDATGAARAAAAPPVDSASPSRRAAAAVAPAVAAPGRFASRGAVLGAAGEAVPVAARLACMLRAREGFPAAVVATWTPGSRGPAPRGPGAPAAARVAARLSARGLAATAHGRLAWLPLDDHVLAASMSARKAGAALDVPFVVALSGPRCDLVESLLDEQDIVLVVAGDPQGPLARLAVAGCSRHAAACAPVHGMQRLLALAGLARSRWTP
jgi:hypothetical protein